MSIKSRVVSNTATAISVPALFQLPSERALIFDVRRETAYQREPDTISGAEWLPPWLIPARLSQLRGSRSFLHPLVMVCVYGHSVSQSACIVARCLGFDAMYLEGGLTAWKSAGLPTGPSTPRWEPSHD